MKIGIVGGTGDIGKGLALRLADAGYDVVIGSRKQEKANKMASEYTEAVGTDVEGKENINAIEGCDVIILGVPYRYATGTVEEISENIPERATVISPVVSMKRDDEGFKYVTPEQGSATQEIREVLPDSNPLAGAFHNVSAPRLADLEDDLGIDVAVFGEGEAKEVTFDLIDSLDGIRGLDAGGLSIAPQVESITPLLINIGMRNKMKHLGIRFV
ncbi:MAG: NADPH-dependent F420 reductase [Halobacteria archaeon]|nr:NADPH-dependent F420 reductase [Halobacteria archaeon]